VSKTFTSNSRKASTYSRTLRTITMLCLACLLVFSQVGCNSASNSSIGRPATDQEVAGQDSITAWPVLLSIAQKSAWQIDKEALLTSVTAFPAERPRPTNWTYTQTLHLGFDFITMSGDRISVDMDEIFPVSTLKVVHRPERNIEAFEPYLRAKDLYTLALSQVQVGPREAGLVTWDSARGVTMKRGEVYLPYPVIGLDLGSSPPRWTVQYRDGSPGLLERDPDLTYSVDAQSGQLLLQASSYRYFDGP
jgi:hypothetical protein